MVSVSLPTQNLLKTASSSTNQGKARTGESIELPSRQTSSVNDKLLERYFTTPASSSLLPQWLQQRALLGPPPDQWVERILFARLYRLHSRRPRRLVAHNQTFPQKFLEKMTAANMPDDVYLQDMVTATASLSLERRKRRKNSAQAKGKTTMRKELFVWQQMVVWEGGKAGSKGKGKGKSRR